MKPGIYTVANSSLNFCVLKVRYQSDSYVKLVGCFVTKTGQQVERKKNYTLDLAQISHWERVSRYI